MKQEEGETSQNIANLLTNDLSIYLSSWMAGWMWKMFQLVKFQVILSHFQLEWLFHAIASNLHDALVLNNSHHDGLVLLSEAKSALIEFASMRNEIKLD